MPPAISNASRFTPPTTVKVGLRGPSAKQNGASFLAAVAGGWLALWLSLASR